MQAIGFKVLTHLNTNTDFQKMQFEAIGVTLKLFMGSEIWQKRPEFSQNLAKMGYGWASSTEI